MKRQLGIIGVVTILAAAALIVMGSLAQAEPPPALTNPAVSSSLDKAYQHLTEVMDKFHRAFDVYTDCGAGGNHFACRARMETNVTIDDAFTGTVVHSGATVIKNTFTGRDLDWGGWYLQNGILLVGDTQPRANWGNYPNAGYDLSGATKLTFWARGERGGERVEFFAFGVGRDARSGVPTEPYPDSSPKVTLCGSSVPPWPGCYITLESTWRPYTITLTSLNLSYIIGGFGWVTRAPENANQDITFYLDDIQYDKPLPNELRFLVSYETIPSTLPFDIVLRNVAFTYDNALALIAFTVAGDQERARLLADAFVYAQQHDRYYTDGRLRSAYKAGDLILPPGWTPNNRVGTASIPGWWDAATQHWYEDSGFVGSDTGNLAWVMIALLNYYDQYGGAQYLTTVITLGNWIVANVYDTCGAGGYIGGYKGWEPIPITQTWKSTEHNLDLYVAFERLYQITGDATWHERALHAKGFVDAMYNPAAGHFWTGTLTDGMTVNTPTIPLDCQTWALLALGENERTRAAIAFAEANHRANYGSYEGFDFNTDRDMPWSEGTAQMVIAYWMLRNPTRAQFYLGELQQLQDTAPNGNDKGIVAAPADGLTTGFDWQYFNRLHVGATAWYVFAQRGYNPYWNTTIAAGALTGRVDLQGRGDDSGAVITLTGSVYTTTTVADGAFTITNVPAGTYVVTATRHGYLYAVRTGVVVTTGETTVLPPVALRAGDSNMDGQVNMADFGLLAASYLKMCGQAGYNERADFNGSCQVNMADFGLLASNYLRMAPTPWP